MSVLQADGNTTKKESSTHALEDCGARMDPSMVVARMDPSPINGSGLGMKFKTRPTNMGPSKRQAMTPGGGGDGF